MKIDQYRQRQRCKHVELEQFLADFHHRPNCIATTAKLTAAFDNHITVSCV